jgi:hypothetical protein
VDAMPPSTRGSQKDVLNTERECSSALWSEDYLDVTASGSNFQEEFSRRELEAENDLPDEE